MTRTNEVALFSIQLIKHVASSRANDHRITIPLRHLAGCASSRVAVFVPADIFDRLSLPPVAAIADQLRSILVAKTSV